MCVGVRFLQGEKFNSLRNEDEKKAQLGITIDSFPALCLIRAGTLQPDVQSLNVFQFCVFHRLIQVVVVVVAVNLLSSRR